MQEIASKCAGNLRRAPWLGGGTLPSVEVGPHESAGRVRHNSNELDYWIETSNGIQGVQQHLCRHCGCVYVEAG